MGTAVRCRLVQLFGGATLILAGMACSDAPQAPRDPPPRYPDSRLARAPATDARPSGRPDDPLAAARFRYQQRLSADGTVPAEALMRAVQQRDAMTQHVPQGWRGDSAEDGNGEGDINVWTWLGPGNIGGRIRAILIHPTQPATMWLGSAGGGIWKTTNSGGLWSPLGDFMASLSIGCMAIDRTAPDVLYAGTGEGFFDAVEGTSNTAAIRGAGIFKSVNGGATWTQLPATAGPEWYFVNRLAISPADSAVLLAATGTGIYRSVDGGATWSQRTATRTLDLRFHPSDASRAVAGRSDGIAEYSLDGGLTWQTATGLAGHRVELAYAPGNPTIVYAAVSDNNLIRVYRSTDGGQSYALQTSSGGISTYHDYNSALWVDPTNDNHLLIGGVNLFRSTNGGINHSAVFGSVHVDHHVIVEHPQFDGVTQRTVYFGNDGGIYGTSNVYSVTPTALNNNLGITQFYGAAVHDGTGVVFGGTQDNGTLRFSGNIQAWTRSFGGDGGYAASDPTDSNYFYGEFQRAFIFRSANGGVSGTQIHNGSPPITEAGTQNVNFIPYFMLDPNEPNRMLVGGRSLWRSNNVKSTPVSWFIIKPTIQPPDPDPPPPPGEPPPDHFEDNSPWNISTLAIAKGDSDLVWVGHNNGQVWRSTNATAGTPDWTRVNENGAGLPDRWISRIVIDRFDHDRVFVSFMGWESDNIWRTTDAGQTWTDITGSGPTGLPDVPVGALAQHRVVRQWLFAGTDVGMFASYDDGQSWSVLPGGPGTIPVDELVWRNDRVLMIVTHGRGIFEADVRAIPGDMNCDGAVDVLDISPFALALVDPDGYAAQHSGCNIILADLNNDSQLDGTDVSPFAAAILSP